METRNELKIAAIVGVIMILICLIVAIVLSDDKDSTLEVYKHATINNQEGYMKCNIDEITLTKIQQEFNKVQLLKEENISNTKKIEGNYKIVFKDKSIAFDKEHNNVILNIKKSEFYNFESEIYNLVINSCN